MLVFSIQVNLQTFFEIDNNNDKPVSSEFLIFRFLIVGIFVNII